MRDRSRSNVSAGFIIGFAALVAAVDARAADSLQKMRPVVLKVTDARSQKPLAGIVVHYLVLRGTHRTSSFGVLPPVEPLAETTIASKLTGSTDDNGEVSFAGVEVPLQTYIVRPREDKIDSEIFFVNLEPSDEAKRRLSFADRDNDRYELLFRTLPELERVTHPNPSYKGYVLETGRSIPKVHGREQENATVEFRPADFTGENKAVFAIQLRIKPATPIRQ